MGSRGTIPGWQPTHCVMGVISLGLMFTICKTNFQGLVKSLRMKAHMKGSVCGVAHSRCSKKISSLLPMQRDCIGICALSGEW